MKQYKYKIIIGVVAAAVLAAAFWWGGSSTGHKDEKVTDEPTAASASSTAAPQSEAEEAFISSAADEQPTVDIGATKAQTRTVSGADDYKPEPVPEGSPTSAAPQETDNGDKKLTCTLAVTCGTILNNRERLNPEKAELVPENGVIFPERSVVFYEGESVFNVLLREMKKNKIHFEFSNTPVYNSAYIEGINNIYEFDCGELSGWMYRVNGSFPRCGCSRYKLKAGDRVELIYTCELGADIGGDYSAQTKG